MVVSVLQMMETVFSSCLGWMQTIFDTIGGTMVVLSAIAVALVASLFVLPVRGRGLPSGVAEFTKNTISGKNRKGSKEEP